MIAYPVTLVIGAGQVCMIYTKIPVHIKCFVLRIYISLSVNDSEN